MRISQAKHSFHSMHCVLCTHCSRCYLSTHAVRCMQSAHCVQATHRVITLGMHARLAALAKHALHAMPVFHRTACSACRPRIAWMSKQQVNAFTGIERIENIGRECHTMLQKFDRPRAAWLPRSPDREAFQRPNRTWGSPSQSAC